MLPELPQVYILNQKLPSPKSADSSELEEVRTVANTNAPSEYVRGRIYSDLEEKPTLKWEATLYEEVIPRTSNLLQTSNPQDEDIYLEIYPDGSKSFLLYVPAGYTPVLPEEQSIRLKTELGGFRVLLEGNDIDTIEISLVKTPKRRLLLSELKAYTRRIDFDKNALSASLREILRRHRSSDALSKAKAIEKHIAEEFLFEMNPKSKNQLRRAMSKGKANAEIAAHLMVTLLRDSEIASRIVKEFEAAFRKEKRNLCGQSCSRISCTRGLKFLPKASGRPSIRRQETGAAVSPKNQSSTPTLKPFYFRRLRAKTTCKFM